MEKQQIKQLALSILEDGGVSQESCDWIINNLSKNDLKLFISCFRSAFKDKNVTVRYAGNLSETIKEKISGMFPGKNIIYVLSDKEVLAGIKMEFGDYILDYSVTSMIIKILKGIRI